MRAERLRNQHLTGPGLPGPVEVICSLGAVQAQDFDGALWALAQRLATPLTVDDLLAAFDTGAFVRTHILRPTWHVVAPADLRWMLALSAPRVQMSCSAGYQRLGIEARTRLRAERAMQRVLEGGRHLGRHDVAAALRRARISTEGQRLVYLLMHAELEGLICSGPRVAGQHTYMLVDERVPRAPALTREASLARLMQRYFTSHGPATAHDAAWWSGLTLRDVREGVALAGDALTGRVIDGRQYWQGRRAHASHAPRRGVVHLLPNFDEYVVAYRDRTALLHPSVPPTSASQSALLSQPLLVDGRSAGTWRRRPALHGARSRPGAPRRDPLSWPSARMRRSGGRMHGPSTRQSDAMARTCSVTCVSRARKRYTSPCSSTGAIPSARSSSSPR